MDPIEFLRAIRRRWAILAACIAVAVAVAWFTTTVAPVGVGPPVRSYKATAVLLDLRTIESRNSGAINNLQTVAALTTVGDVPIRVAKAIKYKGEPQILAQRIEATADVDAGLLKITAASSDPAEAELLANTFAGELLSFLEDRKQSTITQEVLALTRQIDALDREIQGLDHRIEQATKVKAKSRAELLRAERGAKVRQYGFLRDRYQQLSTEAADSGRFIKIQDAAALPQAASGFHPPRTRTSRLLFALILGLLTGVALVLLLERVDTRIRTKDEAELQFGLPVLAEIPRMGRVGRRPERMLRNRSGSADAFRLLSAGVLANGSAPIDRVHESGGAPPRGRAILVTSPSVAEGKSTIVAHLAASLSDVGKRVIVLSCDLRRPRVHRMLGVSNEEGLTQALSQNGQGRLDSFIHASPILGVFVVPSGPIPENASELLNSSAMRDAIAQARLRADVVLIDTPPMLTGDTTNLLREVDAVLVVARVGKTSVEVARRTAELLRRLDAPVAGIALNDLRDVELPSSYYRYRHGSRPTT